jgi:hypothetical protein
MILKVSFEKEEDTQKVLDDQIVLACPCGNKCFVLRD